MKAIALKTYTVRGADGNDLSFSETPDAETIVVSIQQNDEKGRISTARLDKAQVTAVRDVLYSIRIENAPEPAVMVVE